MKYKDLLEKLFDFKKKLEIYDYIHHKREFFNIMKEFRHFISNMKNEETYNELYHSEHYAELKVFFTEKNNYFVRAMESIEALSIMTKGEHGCKFLDLLDAEQIVDNYNRKGEDIQSIDFKEGQSLVMVGCGPFPETLMYFYENTPISHVVGIDNNYEAIYIAGEMIHSLGLTDIDLAYMDGQEFDYSYADIVYIPGFIPNKGELLNRIAESAKEDVQILVFSPKFLSTLIYDKVPLELHPRLKIAETYDVGSSAYTSREMIKIEKYK
ncbi:MAG: hypothetical protein GY828_07530 [Candidatus Gracilibacteria bacterium]|nr:hypothetical protein [Candidatus Gracilibacteria bacterium]